MSAYEIPDGQAVFIAVQTRLDGEYKRVSEEIARALVQEYMKLADISRRLTVTLKLSDTKMTLYAQKFCTVIEVQQLVRLLLSQKNWVVEFGKTGEIAAVTPQNGATDKRTVTAA